MAYRYSWNEVQTLDRNYTLVLTAVLPTPLVSAHAGLCLGHYDPTTQVLPHRELHDYSINAEGRTIYFDHH